MDWRDLEQDIDRELKALPSAAAPETLLPRVMALAAQRQRAPWYAGAWLTWRLEAQLASVLALTVCAFGVWWAMPAINGWVASLAPAGAPLMAWASDAAGWIGRAGAVGRAVRLVIFEPVAFLLMWMVVMAALIGAACRAAVTRLALGGASLQ
jgi:hypothetical protein